MSSAMRSTVTLHVVSSLDGFIANKTFIGVNIDGVINMIPVTTCLTWFNTNPAHYSRKRTIFHNSLKGVKIISCLCMSHPCLNIFSCRTGTVAGRHKIYVNRLAKTLWAGTFRMGGQVDRFCNVRCRHNIDFDGASTTCCEKSILRWQSRN